MTKNVFVLGLDEVNLETLQHMPGHEDCHFHALLEVEQLLAAERIALPELLARAEARLEDVSESVDAIVGYWDFPVSSMIPILCERFGTRGPPLRAVAACEHKYWSRLEQAKVVDEHPRFTLVDPAEAPAPPEELEYPFWLKPVKSAGSALAFHVRNRTDFDDATAAIREGIGRMGEPFDFVLEHLDLPEEIAAIGGQACIAEEEIRGRQVTVEGYSQGDGVHVYGVVDSVAYEGRTSFLRFEYPSTLPPYVIDRLTTVATRVVRQIGLEPATFNIEFFWDETTDELNILEVNPRHSQSHARLFEYVDGVPNHRCMVALALGRNPDLPYRAGEYGFAAKWFVRRFDDGVVRRVPTADEVHAVEEAVPGTAVHVVVHEGERLSQLPGNDTYSYELAHVFTGAGNREELEAKYVECLDALRFEFGD